jgi:hypothetical protein
MGREAASCRIDAPAVPDDGQSETTVHHRRASVRSPLSSHIRRTVYLFLLATLLCFVLFREDLFILPAHAVWPGLRGVATFVNLHTLVGVQGNLAHKKNAHPSRTTIGP